MHEAATCQLKAELKHRKKDTKVLLAEAQQEYDSQSSHHFISLYLDSPEFCSPVQSFPIFQYIPFPYYRPSMWGNTSCHCSPNSV